MHVLEAPRAGQSPVRVVDIQAMIYYLETKIFCRDRKQEV
jgi:hypothetical protein